MVLIVLDLHKRNCRSESHDIRPLQVISVVRDTGILVPNPCLGLDPLVSHRV